MRLHPILLPALLLAIPLSAQTTAPSTALTAGQPVRVQWRGDTAWHETTTVYVEHATIRCYGGKTPAHAGEDDGYVGRLFAAATAIEVRDARGNWTRLPEADLRQIQACGIGQAPTLDERCGAAPQLAKMSVAGAIYGARMNAGSGGPWDEFVSLPNEELNPLTAGERCAAILHAATGPRAAPDSLPLRGIIGLGDLGFAVVRGTPPTGPGGRVTTAITLLDPKLQVLRGWQSTY